MAVTDDQVGRSVAHYRIESVLGSGGLGVVYRARDEKLGRPVALKAISGDARTQARVLRAARAASALDHPHIGAIFAVEETGGAAFLVMALHEGETLRERLGRAAVPPGEARRIVRQVLSALGAAHAAGLVHGDLKPANVFLGRDGSVKVLDFGLAGSGTRPYLAPEQLGGMPSDLRADLWAAGVVLHEMLTGRAPFRADQDADLDRRILDDAPPPLPPGTPADLRALCGKLLEKDRGRRPASADEASFLLAGPPRRWPVLVAAVAVLLLVAGGYVWTTRRHVPAAAPPVALQPHAGSLEVEEAQRMIAQATRERDVGKYHDAAEDFVQAYLRDGDPKLLVDITDAYRLAGEREHAIRTFKTLQERIGSSEQDAQIQKQIDALEKELKK
jgi:tRNA A-37 threonylcarbamoyl transferase component Bud32